MDNDSKNLGDTSPLDEQPAPTTKTASPKRQFRSETIGHYKTLEILGEGGMGVVYRAQQTEPVKREVALKLIKLGMDTKQVIARFESERQALALMDHPNVAKVFDAGATEQGRPYFVMELVHGLPITEHCDRHKLSIDQRLELFMKTCEAVQHAHQKGIIHRDIKPSNILVEYRDGQATPKIIDFGVAKATSQRLTEKTLFTEQGQMVGTPAYMSPEQADFTTQDIDTRSDIYSLGVLLYELLIGTLPFDAKSLRSAGFAEIQRIIRDEEPQKPSTRMSALQSEPRPSEPRPSGSGPLRDDVPQRPLPHGRGTEPSAGSVQDIARRRRADPRTLIKRIRGDLDWVTMKALEKDRTRRYASATDFAADIRRHLNHEPVLASPPSTSYRVKKFVRRNRGLVTAAVIIFVVLVAGMAGTTWQGVVATRQRDRAVAAEQAQNRARQEAEVAREAEAEQRRLAETAEQDQRRARKEAEQARQESELARKEAEQTRDNLKTVTEFQQSMLGDIDAEKMGRGIIDELREAIRKGLGKREDMTPQEVETSLASFDRLIGEVNATNLALQVVDENVLARAVETIDKEFADQPLVRAALQQTVADTYREIGLYERAMPLQQAALETRRHELGDDHPHTLTSINDMGVQLQVMGKYEEALPYFREALETRRRVLGDDHSSTLSSISNMGELLGLMGKFAEAEPYHREALDARRRILGDHHPKTLLSINNMGGLLMEMGKYKEALPYYRETLKGMRRVLGDEHPNTLTSISNMGLLLKSMDKLTEAEPYDREALEGRRRILGDDHPDTLTSINNMGFLLKSMGKYAEAEPYYREALVGNRRVLGDDHPSTQTSINNMGGLLYSMGKYEEAEPFSREALEGRRRVLGDDHPNTLRSIFNMGQLLHAMGKNEEALPYYREALEGYRRVLGDDHPDTLISAHGMGGLLRDLGRLLEAEMLGAEAVRGATARLGPSHQFRLAALAQHGHTLAVMERYAEGEAELLEAREGFVNTFGAEFRRTVTVTEFLVDLYDAWHTTEPGKGYDAKAAEWRAKLPQENGE